MAASEQLNHDLLSAAAKGELDKVEALLQQGADPNAADENGATALTKAVNGKHVDVVNVLIAAKAKFS